MSQTYQLPILGVLVEGVDNGYQTRGSCLRNCIRRLCNPGLALLLFGVSPSIYRRKQRRQQMQGSAHTDLLLRPCSLLFSSPCWVEDRMLLSDR